ncbi:MAG: hypothetical protein ACKVH8_22425 [Pirellulales bacterium]
MRKVPFETIQSLSKLIQGVWVRPLIVCLFLTSCMVVTAEEPKSQHNRVRPVIQTLGEHSQDLWTHELDLSQKESSTHQPKQLHSVVIHRKNSRQTIQAAFQDNAPNLEIKKKKDKVESGTLYKSLTNNQEAFENLSASELQDLLDFKDPSSFNVDTQYRHVKIKRNDESAAVVPNNVANTLFAQIEPEISHFGIQRDWDPTLAQWEAPAFYHRPLYFEEVNLERYGHRKKVLQPGLSAAHFFANTLALPYKLGVNHPCERVYTLGHYRPGDCNPHDRHGLPWSFKGAVYAGSFYTGLAFFIP